MYLRAWQWAGLRLKAGLRVLRTPNLNGVLTSMVYIKTQPNSARISIVQFREIANVFVSKSTEEMDRYVIRNPQPTSSGDSPSKSGRTRMKQTTIESLKGVVVIEDIMHHKSRLQLESSSKEEKLKSLRELAKKIPPRHVMLSTKIGRVINKLKTHSDEEIRKAAKAVYAKWKTHFVEHVERPMMEVQCDLKTEKTRTNGKKLLAGALGVKVNDKLTEAIERETFHIHSRVITNSYKRTLRNLVFTLQNQEEIRTKVLSGEITVTDFVKDRKKS